MARDGGDGGYGGLMARDGGDGGYVPSLSHNLSQKTIPWMLPSLSQKTSQNPRWLGWWTTTIRFPMCFSCTNTYKSASMGTGSAHGHVHFQGWYWDACETLQRGSRCCVNAVVIIVVVVVVFICRRYLRCVVCVRQNLDYPYDYS